MTEEFLHYIWKYKLFNQVNLCTENGLTIVISKEGSYNLGSGPDFNHAKILIGEITWVGNVEIHISSSDWFKHGHQNDPVYGKTILHVVWNYDKPVFDSLSNEIPVLVLNGRVSHRLLQNFDTLHFNENKILCKGLTNELDPFKTSQWLNRLLIERLERKVGDIKSVFEQVNKDWVQTLFIVLAKNMGFKVNELPMMLLAQSVDFKILLKNKDKPFVLEAILLGVSGLIPYLPKDGFSEALKKEFSHQKAKYRLTQIEPSLWKFGKIRPANFPTVRISQLASFVHKHGNLFYFLVRDYHLEINLNVLRVSTSEYWKTHYVFGKKVESKSKIIGEKSIENIGINTIAPMLFFYGKEMQSVTHLQLALEVLEKIPAENNLIIRNWAQNNIFAKRASDSQSLIELTNNYCALKKCLNCGIGIQVLKNETS
ncbi:MAG: hypothetical protein ACI9GM_000538 [Salibacteraceae bacterium]|jgi:hypothetical protein